MNRIITLALAVMLASTAVAHAYTDTADDLDNTCKVADPTGTPLNIRTLPRQSRTNRRHVQQRRQRRAAILAKVARSTLGVRRHARRKADWLGVPRLYPLRCQSAARAELLQQREGARMKRIATIALALALSPMAAQSQPDMAYICRGPSAPPTSVYALQQELVCNRFYKPDMVGELHAGAVHCDDPLKLIPLFTSPYPFYPQITKETAGSQKIPGCFTTYAPVTIKVGGPLNGILRIQVPDVSYPTYTIVEFVVRPSDGSECHRSGPDEVTCDYGYGRKAQPGT